MPVYRHWALVPDLLAALARQTLPPGRAEILLVDNEPEAAPEAAAPRPALPANARILPGPRPGSYAARNQGAAAARGAALVFTDADCRPDPGWLAALAAALAADRAAGRSRMLAGPVRMEPPDPANPWSVYDRIRGVPQAAYIARGYAATANLAVPAALFHALGGFAEARFSGGDAEFCRRAGAAGHGLALVPEAAVAHPCRTRWAEIAQKARRTKGGQVGAGPLPRRLAWLARTLCPPVRDSLAYLRAEAPLGERLTAIAVRGRVWGVELAETARLLAGGRPERQ